MEKAPEKTQAPSLAVVDSAGRQAFNEKIRTWRSAGWEEQRRMTTVLVADDHPLFREAIADALRTMFDRVGVLEAGSMTEAIDQVANANDIDLVLLDLRMPGMSGVKGVRT